MLKSDWIKYRQLGNSLSYKIFVGKIFVLKNFRRVDVLQKYFNMKIVQHSVCNSLARAGGKRTKKVTAMEEFFERKCIQGYHVYKEVWEAAESCWCAKESPKMFPIDTLWLWKRNYHRTFASKGTTGVFAVFATGGSYCRMYSNRAQEIFSSPGIRPTWSSLLSTFQGNAYATRTFRKPVAWPKVVSDRHYWTSYKIRKSEHRTRTRGMALNYYNLHHNVLNYLL